MHGRLPHPIELKDTIDLDWIGRHLVGTPHIPPPVHSSPRSAATRRWKNGWDVPAIWFHEILRFNDVRMRMENHENVIADFGTPEIEFKSRLKSPCASVKVSMCWTCWMHVLIVIVGVHLNNGDHPIENVLMKSLCGKSERWIIIITWRSFSTWVYCGISWWLWISSRTTPL